ncbi:DICT sensory domain-containing protein [Pseudonocardia endophytica]|uniref:Diguanylate cyclase/two-component system sensory protein n=1 Tax=Pseudonocardia endophytica TaxID=401976 RepID=A0A4R1I269_PSEEN|nr:DICT sensory domain-containing protein [Pseudonocardia endophytica]TCK26579.1 diguanylate cyclase/two-component system sensory protein [Pseudonocardia endophytica]
MTGRDGDRTGGAPIAERLSAWAGARAAPNAVDAARVLEQVSGQRPELTTKRSLVAVSHAIERAVLAAPHAEPTIVLALFQRMEYFERERATYERIARTGARVAIGFCDGPQHELPDGVAQVLLDPAEALVNEWSVVAVTPEAGAFLVATDQHGIEPGASSLEAGRRFRSRWGFSRVQATVELARLRLVIGGRLPEDMVRTIDRLLGETMSAGADPASSAGTPQEVWATSAAFHLAERLVSARSGSARLRAQLGDAHAAAAARHAAGTDPQSGLTTPDFLHRWSDGDGTTVLPVGLALFDLPAVSEASRGGTDTRAAYHAARRIASAVTQPLGPVDAAVRMSEREFLIVVPGASELHLARVCDDILEQLTLLSDGYPNVPLAGRLATTVTRNRPLPLRGLRDALAGIDAESDPGPRAAGATAGGDAIVVCATRPASSEDEPSPSVDRDTDGASAPAPETSGQQVIGHGRFPRPFPPARGESASASASGGRAPERDPAPSWGAALGGTPRGDDILGGSSPAATPAPEAEDSGNSVERTAGLGAASGARHGLDDEPGDATPPSSWDRPSWDTELPSGDGSDAAEDPAADATEEPGASVELPGADHDGRREPPPWRREDTLPPSTAVDEVRNLFGRRI